MRLSMRPYEESEEISRQSFHDVVCDAKVSMEIEQDLKLAIGWNKFNMQLIGIWPDKALLKGGLPQYKFIIPGVFMLCVVLPQWINLYLLRGNIDLMTENLSLANIPALGLLLKSFYDDWKAPKSEEERSTMLSYAKITRNVSIWCTVLTESMVTVYITLRLVTIMGQDKERTAKDRFALYPAYYPFDIRESPYFEITCILQIIAAYSATVSYTATDSFVSMLIFHICGQFYNLRRSLENLVNDENSHEKPKEFQKELARIVKKHEILIWFGTVIEDSYNVLFLIQIVFCTVLICFQGFLGYKILMQVDGKPTTLQVFFFIIFVAFICVHIYLYCYVGEVLLVESAAMGNAAYSAKWYNAPAKEAKCLILIMHRSLSPLRLTAGKFGTFSMELFSTVIRTAMGYLSVLLTVATGTE